MPRADSDTPRKMLPPPTTTATSTPSRAVSAISPATWPRTSVLIPYPWCPISASPEILRRMRLYAGLTIAPATLAPRRVVGNRRAEDPRTPEGHGDETTSTQATCALVPSATTPTSDTAGIEPVGPFAAFTTPF